MDVLAHVTVGPADAEFSIIWLHGLGANGHDFEAIVPELDFPQKGTTRFIFPHAPQRPVTVNMGYVMPAWYDVYSLEKNGKQDSQGIAQSVQALQALISAEHTKGVPTRKIVLAGFSQGGVIALHTALTYSHQLAGVMGLSTYLPLYDELMQNADEANKNIPIFIAHGTQDTVLNLTLGEHLRDTLTAHGYQPQWHQYAMPHAVIPREIADISAWLAKVLN